MRRSSSTWLFSLGLVLLSVAPRTARALPAGCLPPVFDGGQRLHPLSGPRVYWLELLLRQHELCWRRAPRSDEVRVVLAGNSAPFGFLVPVAETFAARLNRAFSARGVPAHVFNLAFLNSYQLKDAVILHEALRYAPDVVLYAVTLSEFVHLAPLVLDTLTPFFASNAGAVRSCLGARLPGLTEPLEAYRPGTERPSRPAQWLARLREAGLLLRIAAGRHAQWISTRLGGPRETPPIGNPGRQERYDCEKTERLFARQYPDWASWNILAYLGQLRAERGVEVVIVNWPVAHEPIGTCYSVRYPTRALQRYGDWIRAEAASRGFAYVDLHDLLPPDAFLDSLHVSGVGHGRVAAALEGVLATVVSDLAHRRAPAVAAGAATLR